MIGKLFAVFALTLLAAAGAFAQPRPMLRASDFTLPDASGNKVSLNSFRGKVVLLDFWATWCGPCRRTMPYIQKLYDRYKEDGLVVLAINIEGPKRNVVEYINDGGYTFTILFDSKGEVVRAYRVFSIPQTFLIDRQGAIRFGGHPLEISQEMIEEALGATPGPPPAEAERVSQRALSCYEQGAKFKARSEYGRAVDAFREAIDAEPNFASAHKEFISLMRMMGRTEELVSTYQELAEDNPNSALVFYFYGLSLPEEEVTKRSEAFARAIELDPRLLEAYLELGSIYARQRKHDQAIELYSRALRTNPESAKLHYALAACYLAKGMRSEAEAEYRKALRIDPSLKPLEAKAQQ